MNKYEIIFNILCSHFRNDGSFMSRLILDQMLEYEKLETVDLAKHLAKINGLEIRFDSPAAKEEWENGVRG